MALISNINEVQAVLPKLVANQSEWTNMPNWLATERKYIIPLIGETLYNTLVTNYEGDTLDADETNLVNYLRQAIVPYAFYDDIGLYILMLQDSGVQKVRQGGSEPLREWEVLELKSTLIKKATEGAENSLSYLFTNKALYPEWTSSTEYSKLKSLLIRTGYDFNDHYSIYQPSRTYFILKSIMNDVQLFYISESIGKELLEYLRDVAAPSTAETSCVSLLKKSLAFFTVAKAAKHFAVEFSDKGLVILGDKIESSYKSLNGQAADAGLLAEKVMECNNDGNAYLEKAKYDLVALYSADGVTDDYKTAFDAGPLANYIQPVDKTSGNENRKIFSF